MNLYSANSPYESYEELHTHELKVIENLTKTHPTFTSERVARKPEKFSSLSAEERWNYCKRINDLQKLINDIQNNESTKVSSLGFTLQEVLEVLNVRRAMHNEKIEGKKYNIK